MPRAERVLAKWKTPEDELWGIGRLADALVQRQIAEPHDVCIVAPSNTWALQMRRACQQLGVRTTLCIPHSRLKPDDAAALARLDALARAEGAGNNAGGPGATAAGGVNAATGARASGTAGATGAGSSGAADVAGAADENPADFVRRYAGVRGFAALRACGLTDRPAFEHALLHVVGDEDAAALDAIIREQIARPTLTPETLEIPIMHYRHIDQPFDYAFFIGCVEGLVPGWTAPASADAAQQNREERRARDAFFALLYGTRVRVVASYFTEMQADQARRARIPFVRCKQERGRTMAMLQPTRFFAEMGADRPTTTGGQVLLRDYDLN